MGEDPRETQKEYIKSTLDGWKGWQRVASGETRHLIYSLGQTAVGMREKGGEGGKETNLDRAFPTQETALEESEEEEAEVWFIGKEP